MAITGAIVVAHCPAVGLNVYDEVLDAEVLMVEGLHVPAIDGVLVELAGNAGAIAF